MLDFTLHRKMARVIRQLAQTLHIDDTRALVLFYSTDTARMMRDPKYAIGCQSDTYIVNDIIAELRERKG